MKRQRKYPQPPANTLNWTGKQTGTQCSSNSSGIICVAVDCPKLLVWPHSAPTEPSRYSMEAPCRVHHTVVHMGEDQWFLGWRFTTDIKKEQRQRQILCHRLDLSLPINTNWDQLWRKAVNQQRTAPSNLSFWSWPKGIPLSIPWGYWKPWRNQEEQGWMRNSIQLMPEITQKHNQYCLSLISGPETWLKEIQIIHSIWDPLELQCHQHIDHFPKKRRRETRQKIIQFSGVQWQLL